MGGFVEWRIGVRFGSWNEKHMATTGDSSMARYKSLTRIDRYTRSKKR